MQRKTTIIPYLTVFSFIILLVGKYSFPFLKPDSYFLYLHQSCTCWWWIKKYLSDLLGSPTIFIVIFYIEIVPCSHLWCKGIRDLFTSVQQYIFIDTEPYAVSEHSWHAVSMPTFYLLHTLTEDVMFTIKFKVTNWNY